MDLSPRAVIAGRYRVDTKVGAGGMGEVWLGEHIAVGVRVAVKTLLPAAAMNHEVVARFKREAYLLGRIRSDHVARVVDFVADDVYGLVLVMEFVDGDPLSRLLQERTLTVEEGVDLAVGLASALKDLHSVNIIHRDLKPGNVILTPMPDGRRRAVVVDFGVSRLMSNKDADEDEEITGITRADMAIGTIEYMAPEQILNSRNVTPGSDIYAAGAMLFRSCAGRHVFGNVASDTELAQKKLTTESPPLPLSRTDAVAEGFAQVVARMVKRRPSERYKSADEVLADLHRVRELAGAAAAARESTTIDANKRMIGAAAPPAATVPMPATRPSAPSSPSLLPSASPDSSVSVTAPRPSIATPVPAKRGVSPVVTVGLVAAALVGGVLLGPKLLHPPQQPSMRASGNEGDVAPPAPPPQAPPAAATGTAAAASAPIAAAAPTVIASAAPTTSAVAEDAGKAAPARVPGPMPHPTIWAPMVPMVPIVPTTTAPAPVKMEPK
jgi:serine/threonine-protein kinase